MSGDFRAEICISTQIDHLGNRLIEINILGAQECMGTSFQNNITLRASTRKALENKIRIVHHV